jgi:hypothetical protein
MATAVIWVRESSGFLPGLPRDEKISFCVTLVSLQPRRGYVEAAVRFFTPSEDDI